MSVLVNSLIIHNKNFPRKDIYPYNLKVFQGTDRISLSSEVAFFVGENGTGKSSLIEAIAKRFGLTVWGGVKSHISHSNPFETRLYDFIELNLKREEKGIKKGFLFRAENFFNFGSYLDDLTMSDPGILKFYGGHSLHKQSHGEAFLTFFENRCQIKGLYLLDEPEAALSPTSELALLKILWGLAQKKGIQFIISTHSPILLSLPGAKILSFDHIPIKEISYKQTHCYQLYKQFINDPNSYLEKLTTRNPNTEGENYA